MSTNKNENSICLKCYYYKKSNKECSKNKILEGHLLTEKFCPEFKRISYYLPQNGVCRYCYNAKNCDINGDIESCSQHTNPHYRPKINYQKKDKRSKKIFKKGCICETCEHCVEIQEDNEIKHKCAFHACNNYLGWTLRTYSVKECPNYEFTLREYDKNDNPIFNKRIEDCQTCMNYISSKEYGDPACNCNTVYIYMNDITKPCGYYNKTFDVTKDQALEIKKEVYRCHDLGIKIPMSDIIGEIKHGCIRCDNYRSDRNEEEYENKRGHGHCIVSDGIKCNHKGTWRSWKPRKNTQKSCESCEWNRKSWQHSEYYNENGISECIKNKVRECHDRKTWKYWKKRSIEPITCKNCGYNLSHERNYSFEFSSRCKIKDVSIECQENGWDDWTPKTCKNCGNNTSPNIRSEVTIHCVMKSNNYECYSFGWKNWIPKTKNNEKIENVVKEIINENKYITIDKKEIKNICNICPESCKMSGRIESCSKTPLHEFKTYKNIDHLAINTNNIKIEVNNMSCEEDKTRINKINEEIKKVKDYREKFILENVLKNEHDLKKYCTIKNSIQYNKDIKEFLETHYNEKEIKLINRIDFSISKGWTFEITIKKKSSIKRKFRKDKVQTSDEITCKKPMDLCYERWLLFEKAITLLNEAISKFQIFQAKKELEHLTSCKRKPSGENPCFITCENCGAEMPIDASFCSMCGQKLDL